MAVLGLLCNNLANIHGHVLPNGRMLWHAHPYKPDKNSRSPFQSHTHSDGELLFLDSLCHAGFLPGVFFAGAAMVFSILKTPLVFPPAASKVSAFIRCAATRGPPSLHTAR